jgi:hypothetical protein
MNIQASLNALKKVDLSTTNLFFNQLLSEITCNKEIPSINKCDFIFKKKTSNRDEIVLTLHEVTTLNGTQLRRYDLIKDRLAYRSNERVFEGDSIS